tara:strand:- start:215 stop:634 length:420 start_codon:yes stop_codon:yes gene_type:complete
MTTKSSGFTLIELLVVVAIIGIIAAAGVASYSGYVSATKKKSAKNVMLQASLGQVEYYSENNKYFGTSGSTCSADEVTSTLIETNLLGGTDSINKEMGYFMCVVTSTNDYTIIAEEREGTKKCEMSMPKSTSVTEGSDC